jgi:peptidoglycan/xylan/chitin deacetylase (PgdA/CDA1 family)
LASGTKAIEAGVKLLIQRIAAVGSAFLIVAAVVALCGWTAGAFTSPEPAPKPAPGPVPLTDANCSGGYVVFTFDGGPLKPPLGGTPLVLAALQALHAHGVFFVLGTAATMNPALIRQEVADGDRVENHTWGHEDFTGQSTGGKPMTLAQVRAVLEEGAAAIVKAGAPEPTLYRPPFDDVTKADNKVAASLGERVVMSYGKPGTGIIDSQDWRAKFTGAQIAANTIHGFTDESGTYIPGLDSGTAKTYVIGYHDGLNATVSTPAAQSLQPIVEWMNLHGMCGTTNVPNPADGGIFGGK